jgi:hypothetical protein
VGSILRLLVAGSVGVGGSFGESGRSAKGRLNVSSAAGAAVGSVVSLWRYPLKSMMGEELNRSDVTERGLLADRAYGLVDQSDGKVASAKNPRKWPRLFDFRAALVAPPRPGGALPAVRITLPDGTVATSDQSDVNQILSSVLQREVTLDRPERGQEEMVESTFPNPWTAKSEEYWPDMEGLDFRDTELLLLGASALAGGLAAFRLLAPAFAAGSFVGHALTPSPGHPANSVPASC